MWDCREHAWFTTCKLGLIVESLRKTRCSSSKSGHRQTSQPSWWCEADIFYCYLRVFLFVWEDSVENPPMSRTRVFRGARTGACQVRRMDWA